jgi:hypothetical protein
MCLIVALLVLQDFSTLDADFRRQHHLKDPARYLQITDSDSLKALWKQEQAANEAPDVDFKGWMILALFPSMEGARQLLTVESVKEEKGTFVLRCSLKPSGIDGGPGLRPAYAVVKIRRSNLPVRIVEHSDGMKERIVQEFGPLK